MFKLRKGDLWKAAILILLIAAIGVFIYHTLSNPSAKGLPAPVAAAPKPTAASQPAPAAGSTEEMFTPRQRAGAGELAKARAMPDPFRPEISDRTGRSAPTPLSPDSSLTGLSPAGEPSGLWLAGVIVSARSLAVVREGEERYFVRRGETLPGGWRVTRISPQSITLSRGGEQMSLNLGGRP